MQVGVDYFIEELVNKGKEVTISSTENSVDFTIISGWVENPPKLEYSIATANHLLYKEEDTLLLLTKHGRKWHFVVIRGDIT